MKGNAGWEETNKQTKSGRNALHTFLHGPCMMRGRGARLARIRNRGGRRLYRIPQALRDLQRGVSMAPAKRREGRRVRGRVALQHVYALQIVVEAVLRALDEHRHALSQRDLLVRERVDARVPLRDARGQVRVLGRQRRRGGRAP